MTYLRSGGLGWTATAQLCAVSVSLVSTLALSRLLKAEDFGLIAATIPLIGLAQQLQGLGFYSAIVQARQVEKSQLDALFWIGLAFSSTLAGAIVLAAPALARLMGDARLQEIYTVSAAAVVLTSLAAQPQALLARDLRFRALALRTIIATLAGTVVSIVIAVVYRSYWALVANLLVVPLATLILSAPLAGWRPGLPRKGSGVRPLLNFGSTVWIFNQFSFLARHADNLIVGYATSPHDLGLYNRAYSVLLFPIGRAVVPFGQTVVPGLSRSLDEPFYYRHLYWRAATWVLLVCQPLLLTVLFFPEAVVELLLGSQWLASAPLFAWFAAGGLFEVFAITTTWLLISQGRGQDLVTVGVVNSILALLSFLLGIRWGIVGVAACYVLGQTLLAFPHTLWRSGRAGPVGRRDMLTGLLPAGIAIGGSMTGLAAVGAAADTTAWTIVPGALAVAYLAYGGVFAALPSTRAVLRRPRESSVQTQGEVPN
jgi:PST family polysaccharide transporter